MTHLMTFWKLLERISGSQAQLSRVQSSTNRHRRPLARLSERRSGRNDETRAQSHKAAPLLSECAETGEIRRRLFVNNLRRDRSSSPPGVDGRPSGRQRGEVTKRETASRRPVNKRSMGKQRRLLYFAMSSYRSSLSCGGAELRESSFLSEIISCLSQDGPDTIRLVSYEKFPHTQPHSHGAPQHTQVSLWLIAKVANCGAEGRGFDAGPKHDVLSVCDISIPSLHDIVQENRADLSRVVVRQCTVHATCPTMAQELELVAIASCTPFGSVCNIRSPRFELNLLKVTIYTPIKHTFGTPIGSMKLTYVRFQLQFEKVRLC
uniref:Uncharacterized protein n=1 Tax=Steinernema glaseri TaxID=37863 RepID=A0A1I8AV70_9BILA